MALQPVPRFLAPKTPNQPMATLDAPVARDVLTQAEYEAFRDALPTWRDRLIVMVLRNTGLRINEVLSLEVRHCALDGLAFCRKAGYRPELAWTCCDYADMLRERDGPSDKEKAVSLLDESLAISSELGMRPLMERVLSRRGILGA